MTQVHCMQFHQERTPRSAATLPLVAELVGHANQTTTNDMADGACSRRRVPCIRSSMPSSLERPIRWPVSPSRRAHSRCHRSNGVAENAPRWPDMKKSTEDVGGPWGYAEFLEAIADPNHERHRELKEWFADDFNPHVLDVDWLAEDVAALAERWSRQPAVKRR